MPIRPDAASLAPRRAYPRVSLIAALAVLLVGGPSARAQSSFEETWKEFLDNDRVSNISQLIRPDPNGAKADYLKYVLIYANNDFCGSDIPSAERRLAEIDTYDARIHEAVPGFTPRFTGLVGKVRAYHAIDSLWDLFLDGRAVTLATLRAVEGADRLCEKPTGAKVSYMSAYANLCGGDEDEARRLFEERTLRLAEKTTMRVEDVRGLAPRVARMKRYFELRPALERAWLTYVQTGESPGFADDVPVYPCRPDAAIKALVLRGLADPCGAGAASLATIEALQREHSITFAENYVNGVAELRTVVAAQTDRLETLERAWAAFVPEGKVDPAITFGLEYCATEPLIRAYILLGHSYVCGLADESLRAIDSLQRLITAPLSPVARAKIDELRELKASYQANGTRIEGIWDDFVANGDTLTVAYASTEDYCDLIQQVKDWTMRGLSGDCQEANVYLERIEDFNARFDFKFYEALECRVERLRLRLWECRYTVVDELARLEAASEPGVTYEDRLSALMLEYSMPERPAGCID